jgi:D-glycero-alpha-D-manno-heptose 1-phosphate guanylyltransferase
MEAIILAGGLGTRLRSRLTDLPKAMAPVGGRPFLAWLLDQLVAAECRHVILSVGYLRHAIMNAFHDNYRGMRIDYAIEETPLGTGGAIQLAMTRAEHPGVFVLNGDTWVDANLDAMLAFHLASGRPMTMAVTEVTDTARYGGVIVQGGQVTGFIEKGRTGPGWINAGLYMLSREFPWPEGLHAPFSFETAVLVPFLDRIRPAAFPHTGDFLDIGIPEDLDRAESMLPQVSSDRSARKAEP